MAESTIVDRLCEEVIALTRVDTRRASRVARLARGAAQAIGTGEARARALRAEGHACFASGRFADAVDRYREALRAVRHRNDVEVGRTLSSALQPLIYLGRYRQAAAWAARARQIFEAHGDSLRLARLDVNEGNIYYRQDRFRQALALYRRGCDVLVRLGTPQDVAAVLSNLAACCTGLHRHADALDFYARARAHCAAHEMRALVMQADYNIAQLRAWRGEYADALELYDEVGRQARELGDRYHAALCELDRAEICLELNTPADAHAAARQALAGFDHLGMRYEGARATVALAAASSALDDHAAAADLFMRARRAFRAERNDVWLALTDLSLAAVLASQGSTARARRLGQHALKLFKAAGLPVRAAQTEIALARMALTERRPDEATRLCAIALSRVRHITAPATSAEAWFVIGQGREAQGRLSEAYRAYRVAHGHIGDIRRHLRTNHLKVAFLTAKLPLYESLVATAMASSQRDVAGTVFRFIEQAKSATLADAIANGRAGESGAASAPASALAVLRQELAWHYRQIENEERRRGAASAQTLTRLTARARTLEALLARRVDALMRSSGGVAPFEAVDAQAIRTVLGPDVQLLEYFVARGELYACLLGPQPAALVRLGPVGDVYGAVRYLQLQLSKASRASTAAAADRADPRLAIGHLRELYDALVAPVAPLLSAPGLVVVPHGLLHRVPFHALCDGERFLNDRFAISYAPSASVYRLCCLQPPMEQGTSLVMGMPDASMPGVARELAAVAQLLPSAVLYSGDEATADRLRAEAPRCRYVHIASHGLYRRDHALSSTIRLAAGELTVFDFFSIGMRAELVTLSGCSTGVNAVVGGDEVVGFMRGLLCGGAQAALLSLWDVHDASTTDFMTVFYSAINAGTTKASAFQQAVRAVRERWPHPFYWAPFILVGKAR